MKPTEAAAIEEARTVLRTRIRRWLRAGLIVTAIFVTWFGLGVLTYNDDPNINLILGETAGFH